MSRTHRQQVFLTVVGMALLTIGATSCEPPFTTPTIKADQPLIELQKNELAHYDEAGKELWNLSSQSVRFYDKTQETHADNIVIKFFGSTGEEALIVQAKSLIYHHHSGNLAITGELEAQDSSGLRFSTDEAFWDAERKVLWSEAPVKVEREDFSLTGTGFEYGPEDGTLTTHMGQLNVVIHE